MQDYLNAGKGGFGSRFLQERQQARAYLDRLPPDQLSAVRRLLETMLDPGSRELENARIEDEADSE